MVYNGVCLQNRAVVFTKESQMAKTAVVVSRVDARHLATAYVFYKDKSVAIHSRSGLISQIVEDFFRLLISSGTTAISDTEYAFRILEDLGELKAAGSYLEQVKTESVLGIQVTDEDIRKALEDFEP